MELDRYQLVRTIASGGMGQIYEAVARGHGGFSRRVAIKRLLPELLGDEAARRVFRDEARIASHLHHGNIVQTLDFGVVDGAEFLVLEYVDGIDAHRLLAALGRPLEVRLAAHVIAEIGHALAYAHDRRGDDDAPLGIVHRDVSTHNILLSWEGDVKLTDFGIALAVARDVRTQTGVVKGKLGYVAPELIRGERATPASDVYALGVTLHVLCTGELPGDARPPAALAPLIQRCLAPDRAERVAVADVAREASRVAGSVGRGDLRELLARVRSRATPRSALDDLMGMALVPAADGGFTVERTGRAPPPPARRVPYAVIVVLGILAGAAAAFAFAVTRGGTSTIDARPAVVATAPVDAAVAAVDASPPPIDAAVIRSHPPPAARPDARSRSAPTSDETGWLTVGGRALIKGAIEIDGARRGFAPHELELSVGRHRVVVRSAAGAVLVETTIFIEARHTQQDPVRVVR